MSGTYFSGGFSLGHIDRKLNTFVNNQCASACVVVFADGQKRMTTRDSIFGLHRSGVAWRCRGDELTRIDLAVRIFFLKQGVSSDFVARGVVQPLTGIWEPSHRDVMSNGLAIDEWSI